MDVYKINGGKRLQGTVKISGAKEITRKNRDV